MELAGVCRRWIWPLWQGGGHISFQSQWWALDLVTRDGLICSFCKVRVVVRKWAHHDLAFLPMVPIPTAAQPSSHWTTGKFQLATSFQMSTIEYLITSHICRCLRHTSADVKYFIWEDSLHPLNNPLRQVCQSSCFSDERTELEECLAISVNSQSR